MSTTILKRIFFLLIVCIAIIPAKLFAQKQILQLDTARNYRSESHLSSDPTMPNPVLVYNVTYEKPNEFDLGFTHSLVIEMIDTIALKKGKILNVAIDTGVVKCWYTNGNHTMLLTRMMQPERFPTTMIGTIKVLNWAGDAIEFEFDIAVKEGTRKGFLFYQGSKKLSRAPLEIPAWLKEGVKKDSK